MKSIMGSDENFVRRHAARHKQLQDDKKGDVIEL